MNEKPETRLALLGTMSELHLEPVSYDLARLRAIVADLAPDLLCAEITRAMWEGGQLSQAAMEVREALAPVVAATDVVLVPVAPSPQRFADFAPDAGWRLQMVQPFDGLLRWGQRRAATPEAVNGLLSHCLQPDRVVLVGAGAQRLERAERDHRRQYPTSSPARSRPARAGGGAVPTYP